MSENRNVAGEPAMVAPHRSAAMMFAGRPMALDALTNAIIADWDSSFLVLLRMKDSGAEYSIERLMPQRTSTRIAIIVEAGKVIARTRANIRQIAPDERTFFPPILDEMRARAGEKAWRAITNASNPRAASIRPEAR